MLAGSLVVAVFHHAAHAAVYLPVASLHMLSL